MPKGQKKRDTPQVISQFRTEHGDYYDYSKVEFVNSHQKVKIICPMHGGFEQTPAIHLRGGGCPECGHARRNRKRSDTTDRFIEKAKVVHGDRYDYTPTTYLNSRSLVAVTCYDHGLFVILPGNHLRGSGCRICALSSDKQLSKYDPTEEFQSVHGDRYDYREFVYASANTPGTIICSIHGAFKQSYKTHRAGHGCPKCANELR